MSLRVYLGLVLLLVFAGMIWYIFSLRGDVHELETEKEKYRLQAETIYNYVGRYETAKRANDSENEKLSQLVSYVPINTKCNAPVELHRVIDRLR